MFTFILICFALIFNYSHSTPLDDYVNVNDGYYNYSLIKIYEMTGYKLYILNMTSQKWLDETVVSQSIWWHYVGITVPDVIKIDDAALLFIDGGANYDGIPLPSDKSVELISTFAATVGCITVDLQQMPNQPIVFKKDSTNQSRTEDDLIGYTWKSFIDNTSDPNILLQLPMTKAVVKAMDASTEFTKNLGVANLEKFMVSGASKRGWISWLTAAVDNKRVFAATPIVFDLLNMNNNLHHHYKSLGGWTFAFNEYYNKNITLFMDTLQMISIQKIIDPLTYFDRYLNTKLLLINSAGDEFFLLDNADYFWEDLRAATNGTVMVRRIPNAEHTCAGHLISIILTLRSFFLSVYYNKPLPDVKWIRPNNITHGITIVTVNITNGLAPINVTVYYARTLDDKRRDFRLAKADPNDPNKFIVNPVIWLTDSKIIKTEQTKTTIIYTVEFQKPLSGWYGFFIQITFPGLEDSVLEISTEVNVIPETFPYPDCYREQCYGNLV